MYNKHMHLPINTIHWYIGIPFALFIGIRGIMQYKKDGSKLNQYIGLSGLVFALCFLVYGLPALFIEESGVLTISTILGDILQFVALLFMWAAVVRVFTAKKPFFKGIFIALIGVLFVASVYLSITTNLANPVTITQASDGLWTINFYFSGIYSFVTAIQYASFLLLAAFFASQARFTKDKFKKLRIYSIAAILFVVGAVYVIQPVLTQGDFRSTTLLLAVNLMVAGVFIAATLLLSNRKNK